MTRAKILQFEPLGIIVHRKFDDDIYSEREVTHYDPINNFYTIKYQDGEGDEYDHNEIKKYKKPKQWYQHKQYACMLTFKTDNNIFFIPTKASPNPVKRDYKLRNATSLLK